jgi:probable addiction module antidote protein
MVTLSRYDSVDYLDSNEGIAEYLQAAMERGDEKHLCRCLAKATKARAINQLAKETGIDRKALCRMLDEDGDSSAEVPSVSPDAIARVAKAFAVPVSV